MRKLLILSIALVWSVSTPMAKEFRVSSASEISSAMENASPGDVLILANGVWKNQEIIISGEGSADTPIVIRAETPGKVTFSGETTLWAKGKHIVVDGIVFKDGGLSSGAVDYLKETVDGPPSVVTIGPGSHIRLTNCAIENYNPGDEYTEYRWVRLEGSHHEVDHCSFSGKTNRKPILNLHRPELKPHRHHIHHNHFSDRPKAKGNGYETIQLGTGGDAERAAFVSVENNLFEGCNGEIEIISNKTSNNVFRGNVFKGNRGMLTLRNGHNNLVEGNVFLGDGVKKSGGVRITGKQNKIVGNYFAGLLGSGARSALTVMTGTKNTDGKGGYNQVNGNLIASNILLNNKGGIYVGYISKRWRDHDHFHPISTRIENNVVLGAGKKQLILKKKIAGIHWKGNSISASLPEKAAGIDGIEKTSVELMQGPAGLMVPKRLEKQLAQKLNKLSKSFVGASWRRVPLLANK